ncbi:AmpG family muropeptide MFS transporter [Aquabacter spiritensis]|uniref:PAT family beta-lactamase induction signal transducer AmpG n=1 Tax=Aquabacter spiritensis TaxID=933073 RepID=A0A4R3LYE1_9HYPH|nr:MFS transporter [Aquabacter spiritensis]TCT05226.1 PAT family beta-lactamase induction signal transducer AmpG [Aquabacter spiritensis]
MSERLSERGPRAPAWEALTVYLRPSVLVVILLGFSSGLPLALTGTTLSVWMTESGVNLGTIGLFALVGLPYTLKFLWAPVVDAIDVPVLSRWLGRRRGWLLATQIALVAAILFLGFQDPARAPVVVALGAVLLAAVSATQDIVVDAFRVERLDTSEQAAGMAGYVAAYRIGMLASGAGVIAIVAGIEALGVDRAAAWTWGYLAAAGFMLVGMTATLAAREPEAPPRRDGAGEGALVRVFKTAYGAFAEFLSRREAVTVLLFVLLYKFSDAFAGVLTAPFVIALGFDKATYAAIVKGVGLAAALAGGFAGGALARALPLVTCLWIGGILQMTSNLAFSAQAMVGVNVPFLTGAIIVENFCGAIGTVVFVAYLSALCGARAHTATQYALLTALTAVGRTVLASGGGFLAEETGWAIFFAITALAGIPGLLILFYLQARRHFVGL